MDKEVNYSAGLQSFGTTTEDSNQPVDYMFNNPQQHQIPSGFCGSASLDKLSFAEVMRFADFGPKLALNQTNISEEEREEEEEKEEETGIDFLKFPVLNDKLQDESLMLDEDHRELGERGDDFEVRVSLGSGMQAAMNGENPNQKQNNTVTSVTEAKNKRKRPRTIKTSEEVESQRMTHIAVERNRRKQMNEHLRVLRSLMPGSYVQRGDQASIIGGAIEFVRELEQLLQCLESQKRRRLYGDHPPGPGSGSGAVQAQLPQPPPPLPSHQQLPFFPGNDDDDDDQLKQLVELEETAESKSCLADVEVKMLGFDAMIKILSRRRPGQLINTIAALQQDLQLNILHTNITTIEQTVLYTFNVKVPNDARFTAEDIAGSVQQIFTFIHANSGI